MLKNLLLRIIPGAVRRELQILRRISHTYGHYASVKKNQSIDGKGNPIPWFTYPCIEYLDQFDYSDKIIFEWGSGNSTLFWSKRAKRIISVEDNTRWFELVKAKSGNNVHLNLIENEKEYVDFISTFNMKFDIIVIDAKYRRKCAEIAPEFLNKGGVIILDNADRHPLTCKKLRSSEGLVEVDFHGFTPIYGFTSTTSIFISNGFNIKVKDRQPMNAIGSLKEVHEFK